MAKLRLWLAFGQRRGTDTLHWILILAAPGAEKGTYYHVTGGPTQRTGYTLEIKANKRFHSHGISKHHFVAEIDEKDVNKLKAATQNVSPRRCQEWTVKVLGELERKGLVPEGTRDYWFDQVESSPYSTDGVHGIVDVGESSGGSSRRGGSSSSRPGGSSSSRPGGSSSSRPGGSSSSRSGGSSSPWVWDDTREEYRLWDAVRGAWIYQSQM